MDEVRPIFSSDALALKSDRVLARMFWIATFAGLTALGAQLEIPHQPVPYTLQTFFVLLAGGMLGKRDGALSMMLYLGLGVVGLPVFSAAGFGPARLVGPTGGYLLSFPVAAYLVGLIISQRPSQDPGRSGNLRRLILRYGRIVGGMIIGLFVIFSLGTIQLNAMYLHSWKEAIQSGFLIFSWWDLLKLGAAAVICKELGR